jgi:hypothetical protein
MPARCGKKYDFLGLWMKNRTDYGDVRKMPTAREVTINGKTGRSKGLAILQHEVNWSSEHHLP